MHACPRIPDSSFQPITESGCHVWVAHTNPAGFGRLMSAGRTWLAHRAAYLIANGRLPANQEIRHKCGVRTCINPAHLYAFDPSAESFSVDATRGLVIGARGTPIGWVGGKGYVYVYVKPHGRCLAHRVVWESVYGPIPAGLEVNHKNCIKADNRIENLELVTHRENVDHAVRHGRYSKKPGGISRARSSL